MRNTWEHSQPPLWPLKIVVVREQSVSGYSPRCISLREREREKEREREREGGWMSSQQHANSSSRRNNSFDTRLLIGVFGATTTWSCSANRLSLPRRTQTGLAQHSPWLKQRSPPRQKWRVSLTCCYLGETAAAFPSRVIKWNTNKDACFTVAVCYE